MELQDADISPACATAGAARGAKSLFSGWIQAIFTSSRMPLGEFGIKGFYVMYVQIEM